jgi:hypothetical protein
VSGTTKGLPLERRPRENTFSRKDHPERDEKQDDSACDANGLLLEPKEPQKMFADRKEHQ